MSTLTLKTALVNYGHTQALLDGRIRSQRVALEHIEVSPIPSAFRRMVRNLEFDLSEMAFATYLCARAHQKPMTALPIFVLRRFEHGQIVCHADSDIHSPADLPGRRVGARSYTLTPAVWTRGILQHAYGVDLNRVTWVITGDEHVAEYVTPSHVVSAPADSNLLAMLKAGEIDAAIGVRGDDTAELKPLIPDAHQAAAAYFRQTGIFPISHLMVVKDELLDAHPWLAEALFNLFNQAKDVYLGQLNSAGPQTQQDQQAIALQEALGGDPFRYGIVPNRATLEVFIQCNVEQQIIPQPVSVEEIFPTSVIDLV